MPTPLSEREPAGAARVGEYRLLTRIGEGGMGVVHLAQSPDGRRVALKVLRSHVVGDDEARERLAQEVSSLGRVRSPRVAEVLDADPWGPTPFVATRYVPGLSLHEHCRRHGPILGADLAFLATGLVEAVVAVHAVGVLHRDIKPANVLLEGRAPVLIDFGLARLAEDPRLTQTGWLLGTPGYLAPEILFGDDATPASDVHSWAATVAFAATGRPPFGTGPAMAIMDRVRRGEHDLSAVPRAIESLLRACLVADPTARPDTATVLARLHASAPRSARPAAAATPQSPAAPEPPPTMPFALAGSHDDARSDTGATEQVEEARSVPTTVQPAARAPYDEPPPPRLLGGGSTVAPDADRPRLVAPASARQPTTRDHRLRRALTMAGLLVAVALAFASVPPVTVAAVAVLALAVRTVAWTGDAARSRQHLRGRRRWYDGPLTVLTTPWYLLLASAGTVALIVVSAVCALVVGLLGAVLGGVDERWLVAAGAVFALATWWGPGSGRLRFPARRVVVAVTRRPPPGWVIVAVVWLVAVLCLAGLGGLIGHGVDWSPLAGAPWRSGTWLGSFVRWL